MSGMPDKRENGHRCKHTLQFPSAKLQRTMNRDTGNLPFLLASGAAPTHLEPWRRPRFLTLSP